MLDNLSGGRDSRRFWSRVANEDTCRVQQDINVWIGQGKLIPYRLTPGVTDQEWQALRELKIHTHPEAFNSLIKHCANQTNSQWSGFNNFLLGLGEKTSKQNHNSILKEANKASPVLIWSLPSTPVSDSTTLLLLLCPPDTWPPFICYITPCPCHFTSFVTFSSA